MAHVSEASVPLLDADPELGARLSEQRFELARRALVVPALSVDAGSERDLASKQPSDSIGLLVVDGLLMREIEIAGVGGAELLGGGDVIHPGDVRGGDLALLRGNLRWSVLKPARLAVLGAGFVTRVASWPEVMAAIALRAVWRTHGLAVSHSISHHGRVDDRLLLLFWHFAQRWGRVRPDGVRLDLPLTHELVGEMVGSARETVTWAFAQLAREGFVEREGRGYRLAVSPASLAS
jgi:CRP/FNR family transcriptional regulator, cyclic AMP receptor protein